MNVTLSNDLLTVVISTHGAELLSIVHNRTGYEYLWQGDPAFWRRRSPVLFPIVGSLRNGTYTLDGLEHAMSQHGFARDCEFEHITLPDIPESEAWFELTDSPDTLALFPRRFTLRIGYSLHEARISVMWQVVNPDDEMTLPFHIGAHPAFNLPDFSLSASIRGYFDVDARSPLMRQTIVEEGCVGSEETEVELNVEGLLPITAHTFEHDAIIIPDAQLHRVSLLTAGCTPYVTLLFNSPLVGLWSPSPSAPFVCIEPWWGRCDSIDFEGEFASRRYTNILNPKATFNAGYTIIIDNI